ncbi:uncharacterized protein EAE98_004329 [Botrytis deweyae]|uniref:Uncharacterized protein n=1 Tax=Botrytis deweyae TaxID=2478750 RepID=A0ABQ7IQJ5_9HELO|nr:uncharacterized protein EAE98_004329 [Botrytis deweyae]KAF7931593.1 hypothetical protein EAE98_004329 [Botrytis deweyae]
MMDRRPQYMNVPSYPSLLKHGTSHPSPLSPLTPPRRLHQRSLLPSPPISPHLHKPPPPIPYPWIWRCHICHSVYRLGVTRRCLEDGHYFCSLPTPPPSPQTASPVSPSPSTSSLSSLIPPKKKKKRRRQPRGCRAEFDYTGWEHYNHWRRDISLLKTESRSLNNPHFIPPLKIGKDCYRDCDFPSECQTIHLRSAITPKTRQKSEPELIFPISPISAEERQRIDDEREDQQLIFDIAATTPPATRAHGEFPSSSTLMPDITSPDFNTLVERDRRKSLEAEKRGLEHEAQFIVSPLTSHTAFADINYGGSGSTSPKGKECENERQELKDGLGVSYPPELDDLAGEEETEEDEQGYVREFIRVKKRKSIAKIEQLTGLRLSEVQYGKMVGEVVDGDLGGPRVGEGEGSKSRRASVEIESPPSSPLKMFYTVEDSDDEDDLDEVTPWDEQRRKHIR